MSDLTSTFERIAANRAKRDANAPPEPKPEVETAAEPEAEANEAPTEPAKDGPAEPETDPAASE